MDGWDTRDGAGVGRDNVRWDGASLQERCRCIPVKIVSNVGRLAASNILASGTREPSIAYRGTSVRLVNRRSARRGPSGVHRELPPAADIADGVLETRACFLALRRGDAGGTPT
jgi:hypothetical protein